MSQIVFCMTTLDRTGAEVAILNLIKHSEKYNKNAVVVAQKKGELANEIPAHIPVYDFESFYMQQSKKSIIQKVWSKIAQQAIINYWELFLEQINQRHPQHIWYINTMWLPEILDFTSSRNIYTIQHIHALSPVYTNSHIHHLKQVINYPKLLITCSQATSNVMNTLGRTTNLEISYPMLNTTEITITKSANEFKAELGISEKSFVWVMSGSINPNKDPETFIHLAHYLKNLGYNITFLWLGGNLESSLLYYINSKIKEYQLDKQIKFTGALSENYYNYFNIADAFILTSKEESFGIVIVEALALGKPVLGFDSVGIREILNGQDDIGRICESWNLKDMAILMQKVMNKEITFDSKKAKARAAEFSIAKQLDHWESILDNYL